MAAPVVESTSDGVLSGTSTACTLPTGIASGDVILVLASGGNITTFTATNYTVLNQTQQASTVTSTILYREATADSNDNLTIAATVSSSGTYAIYRISGADVSTLETSTAVTGSGAAADPPSHTPSGGSDDYLYITPLTVDRAANITAQPSGYTDFILEKAGSGASASSALAAKGTTASSSDDPGVWAHTNENYIARTMSIAPASGGGTTVYGTATIAGTSTVSAVGEGSKAGTATIAATSTVSAIGAATKKATATIASTSSVSSVGSKTAGATATITSASTVSAIGTGSKSGLATIASTSTVTAVGTGDKKGVAAIAAVSTVTAAGSVGGEILGTATIAAASTVTAVGTASKAGVATVASTSTVSAAGKVTRGATATIASTSTVSAVGTKSASATCTIAAVSSVLASGVLSAKGAATIAATSTVSAVGTLSGALNTARVSFETQKKTYSFSKDRERAFDVNIRNITFR